MSGIASQNEMGWCEINYQINLPLMLGQSLPGIADIEAELAGDLGALPISAEPDAPPQP